MDKPSSCYNHDYDQDWLLLRDPLREQTVLATLTFTLDSRFLSSRAGTVINITINMNRAKTMNMTMNITINMTMNRDKCDIKLTSPFKFKTGRSDCVPTDLERPYASSKPENHPLLSGTAQQTLDFLYR